MTFNLPLPGIRAGTSLPRYGSAHLRQSDHHELGCCVAPANQSFAVSGISLLTQYPYLFALGGLIIPAICPDPDSTKRDGPDRIRGPA